MEICMMFFKTSTSDLKANLKQSTLVEDPGVKNSFKQRCVKKRQGFFGTRAEGAHRIEPIKQLLLLSQPDHYIPTN